MVLVRERDKVQSVPELCALQYSRHVRKTSARLSRHHISPEQLRVAAGMSPERRYNNKQVVEVLHVSPPASRLKTET